MVTGNGGCLFFTRDPGRGVHAASTRAKRRSWMVSQTSPRRTWSGINPALRPRPRRGGIQTGWAGEFGGEEFLRRRRIL